MTADSHALVTTDHSPVAGLAHDERGGISNPILGMLLFITSEVMFFAGLFAAYFNTRFNAAEWPPQGFDDKLHVFPLVGPATVLLITSSFTCQFAIWAIRRNDRTGFLRNMSVTVLLGALFLVIQAIDYTTLYGEGMTIDANTFGTTYFTLTGFHGAHVFGGVVGIAVVLLRGAAGQFSAKHHIAVEAVSAYWHFVDIVWIGLFATLYFLK